MKGDYLLDSKDKLKELDLQLRAAVDIGPHIVTIKKVTNKRSLPQNASLHLYCEIMAEKLTDAGFTQNSIIELMKNGFEIPINSDWVKNVFRKVGFDEFGKESTADLSTVEMSETYKFVDAGFSQLVDVRADWPSLR